VPFESPKGTSTRFSLVLLFWAGADSGGALPRPKKPFENGGAMRVGRSFGRMKGLPFQVVVEGYPEPEKKGKKRVREFR